MRLIVAHEQPDFDALASLALAKLLFPGAVATVQGGINKRLAAFLSLYRDEVDLTPLDQIDLDAVSELIVVDTSDPSRIRPFDQLLGKVQVTLYDHHPPQPGGITAARGLSEQLGATATLLTRELIATAVPIPAPLATLALLGIHEDTGNLTFDRCSPDDYRAAGHLLASGANLAVVRRFARDHLSDEQLAFRAALLEHAYTTQVAGRDVVAAAFEYPHYVSAVSTLVGELGQVHSADAVVVAVRMEGRTLVFARSDQRFDSAAALATAAVGGGHRGAAFGRSDDPPEEVVERVLTALADHATPVLTAAELMNSPVKSVPESMSVAAAQEQLLLFGHNGMPVVGSAGEVVGVVSRRDLDRALRHGLGGTKVSGFMTRNVISAPTTASLRELEELVLHNNIGRIPILDGAKLVGIVTRTDLIGARHHQQRPSGQAEALLARLPEGARAALQVASELAGDTSLYLVGGTVRDLLLGAGVKDIDLVVEGESAAQFGARLQRRLGGALSSHLEFGTATLTLDSGLELDVATAREEVYARPGVLPDVTPSSVRKDLTRRDFGINALAIRLHPEPRELIDPFAGADDLAARQLRILHQLSFVEDPTRILRGARLAGRLGFHFERFTADQARSALAPELLTNLSHSRLRAELELTFAEPRVAPALRILESLGALEALFDTPPSSGPLSLLTLTEALDGLRREGPVPDEAYLLALLVGLDDTTAEAVIEKFNWPRRLGQVRERLLGLIGLLGPEKTPSGEADSTEERSGEATASAPVTSPLQSDRKLEPILDEELESLGVSGRSVLRAADPALAARLDRLEHEPARRKLRGSDVVALGLLPGPSVGRVLDEVARARAEQRVATFDDELDLARRLVAELGDAGGME